MTVEEAARLMAIVPPEDPELAADLVQVVEPERDPEAFSRARREANRDLWRMFVDPDCVVAD